METTAQLQIAFYGDDFTGSTDALEQLTLAGIKCVLFIDVPTSAQLARYPGIAAFGVAGMTRSLAPREMEDVLEPAFRAIAQLKPQFVHYKVCSTFDSSPTIGSIGTALDLGVQVFGTKTVPLLVAVPKFGRYSLFGNLFARMGIGSNGQIYRLDRHPSMRKHPSTPADESDIRLHLAKQTKKKIGLFDLLQIHRFKKQQFKIDFEDNEIVLFDAVEQEDLHIAGHIIASMQKGDLPLFTVGSSAIEMALGAIWADANQKVVGDLKLKNTKSPILVVSGSCSPVTAEQIKMAIQHGFETVGIATADLAMEINIGFDTDDESLKTAADQYAEKLLAILKSGKSAILHTSLGSDDPRLANTARCLSDRGLPQTITAKLYGTLLGDTVRKVTEQFQLERVVIAGGDTSSYAAKAMGIEAVEMVASLSPGAPICLVHGEGSIHQLQVIFKGGQVGGPDFFIDALK